MITRTIGSAAGPATVSAIGYGAAALSLRGDFSEEEAIAALRLAADEGITLFDTARVYTTGDEDHHNERMFAEAFGDRLRDGSLFVSSKGGHFRRGDYYGLDGRAAAMVSDCEGSIRVLGVDAIDLYFLHKPDPDVSIEESIGALASLRERGLIRRVGASNFSLDELKRAQQVTTIDAVQNRFELSGAEPELLEYTEAEGIAYLDYSPLKVVSDWAVFGARPEIAAVAERSDATPQQLVLAWLLTHSPSLIPVTGATRSETIRSSAAAAALELDSADLAAIAAALG